MTSKEFVEILKKYPSNYDLEFYHRGLGEVVELELNDIIVDPRHKTIALDGDYTNGNEDDTSRRLK